MKHKFDLLRPFLLTSLAFLASCSGGGGGDDGGGSSDGRLTRTSGTSIRVIHAGLDESPVSVLVGDKLVQSAKFAQATFFAAVSKGDQLVRVERTNAPAEVISQFPQTFDDKTEYTVFIYGQHLKEHFQVKVLSEPVAKPAKGFARVNFLHAANGVGSAYLNCGSSNSEPTRYGNLSTSMELAVAPVACDVIENGVGSVSRVNLALREQGEATILLTGAQDAGGLVTQVFEDLD